MYNRVYGIQFYVFVGIIFGCKRVENYVYFRVCWILDRNCGYFISKFVKEKIFFELILMLQYSVLLVISMIMQIVVIYFEN